MDAKIMLRRRLFQSTTWMLFIMISVAEAVKLNEHILHYEGLNYDTAHVNIQHRRVARSTDIQQRVEIKFNAHGRDFHLRLKRDVSTFSKEFRVVTSQGEIPMPFQDAPMYIGELVDEIDTYCHGTVREGKFEGRIQIPQSQEYYSVEPSSRYLEGADFHSVIYKDEDVVQAETKDDGLGSCGVKGEIKKRMDEKLKNLRHSEADVHDVPYRKKRQTINEDEQTCSLFIQADHTFYERHGSVSAVVTQIGQHVQAANAIYGNTDFGDYRNISFSVERLRVWTPEDIGRTSYLFGNNYIGVEKFLDLASTGNFNAYCLAYTFANRDFANGVLGLAWIASSSRLSNGGICDKQASNGQTLNTGIVTTNNYESNVPPLVSHLTFAHEIGHSFGSQHDPGVPGDACVPGGALGNYIMFSHSSAGNLVNNQRFSPCSITTISNILSTVFLGYSKTNCFKSQSDITFCGNGITEEGEECDCGYEEECTHSCCVPQNADHTQPNACRLANQAQCSPTEGVCCDSSTCTYKASSEQCEQSDECHGPAFCPGDSSICPVPTPEADLTQCDNGRKLCHNGECTRSICFLQNRRECQCTDEAELCDLCCLDDRTNLCLSSYRLGLPPGQAEPLKTDAGSPCGDYMGYCDGFHNCREVDEDGPLASIIRKIFYSDEPQLTDAIREWLTTYWYVVLIIGIAIIILMILIVVLCNRVIPTDNPWDQEVERFKKRSSVYVKLQRKRYRGSMAPGMHPPPIESHPDHLVEDRATPF
ncbi:disintegrin and metalloproteinase domain-containing protein 10-like [Lytechinus variegatus]|uniref:disintegrin and metalloproteinase domain-containing protein 10-like n=1 Tax=Lytechinus variegatus TaxID=7654 RepID=UPI001BB2A3C1|nr:disintegrin and metalloproteinase domain-containing protein 10-like [Lytechinus variegatus]